MNLFFDENLSHHLVKFLNREYPSCSHVRFVDMVGFANDQI
jgi:predicted nuclease of predicted toxin-antitoxin system